MRELAAVSLAGVLISLALSAGAADISAMTAPYMAARERKAVGVVVGRAYEEARRTGGGPKPFAGVSVLLLPDAGGLGREPAAIKAGRRGSPVRFFQSGPQ